MTTIKQPALLVLLLIFNCIISVPSYANEQTENINSLADDIYRIEVIIFANRHSQTEEQWRKPLLSYPEKKIFLRDASTPLELVDTSLLTSIPTTAVTAISPTTAFTSESKIAHTQLKETTASGLKATIESSTPNVNLATQLPDLLIKLDADDFSLKNIAKRLQQRAAYEILFHEAWYQVLENKELASAIPIQGGHQYEEHYQLEGSITLSKNRFLHISSNLWLAEFTDLTVSNSNAMWYQNIIETIELPDIPQAPAPKIVKLQTPNESEFTLTTKHSNFDNHHRYVEQSSPIVERDLLPSIEEELGDYAPSSPTTRSTSKSNIINNGQNLNKTENNQPLTLDSLATNKRLTELYEEQNPTFQPAQFAAKKVYFLKEYRRIKRDEIHYLDHPKFGIIIRMKKYEAKPAEQKKPTLTKLKNHCGNLFYRLS